MESTILECHSPATMNDPSPSTSLDQVSSLREAALSTLRAKRRKPGLEKTSLSRPPPPASIQLDYGQDESPQPVTKPTSSSPPRTIAPSNVKQPEFIPKDVQMREEGEISEEEDTPPAPPALKETPKSTAEEAKHPSGKPVSLPRRFSVASRDLNQVTTQSRRSLEPSPVSPQSKRHRSTTPGVHLSAAHLALLALDENHVRPGLQMTQQEYDTAKDIVLDLLGWDVPPEYLVECGLSRELVFYVFAELNLRLPRNLDTTGLIPYTPEAMSKARQAATATLQVVTPVSSPIQSSSLIKAGNDVSHISQPAESSFSLSAKSTLSSHNLHDIEMQRRQELLARKAVLASRKSKQPSTANIVTTSRADSAAPKPTSAVSSDVDTFLKSIAASKAVDIAASDASSSERATSLLKSDDGMDIDDIPGLGGLDGTERTRSPNQLDALQLEQSQLFTESSHFAIEKSDSVSSVGSLSSMIMDGQIRRGTKRPVASDFVDLDTNMRLSTANGRHDHGNFHPLGTRKVGAIDFGSVNNGHRRCVIDLSDSEDESKGEGNIRRRPKRRSFDTPGSSATPPVIPTVLVNPGTVKEPSVLELEIQRMKELIAKKEQDRLRKLATRAQNPLDSSASTSDVANLKQEDVDHSLHAKSPNHHESLEAGDIIVEFPESYESSDASITSVAAALAGPYTGTSSSTTPVIDDEAFDPIMDRTNAAVQLMNAESAEDAVMQNVIDVQVTNDQDIHSIEHVDVDVDMSSSAQVTNKDESVFLNYQSPLALYPHLRTHYQVSNVESETQSSIISINNKPSTDRVILTNDSRSLETDIGFLDLKLLKLAAAMKRLDPSKHICQYEIPGGGTCRDGTCEDIHLSWLMSSDDHSANYENEPNDDDTAEYLFKRLPREWLHHRDVKSPGRIKAALEGMQLQASRMRFEDRVMGALAVLKPPSLPE